MHFRACKITGFAILTCPILIFILIPPPSANVYPALGRKAHDDTIHVALLVGGAVRSLVAPVVHRNLRRYVVDELQNRPDSKVSLLLDISFHDRSSWGHTSQFPSWTEDKIVPALEVLKPDRLLFYEASEMGSAHGEGTDVLGRNCSSVGKFHLVEASIAHFESSKRLFREAQNLAQTSNFEFEWFVRTRPDMLWLYPFPLNLNNVRDSQDVVLYDASWPWFMADYFYIVHRSVATQLWGLGSDILSQIPCDATGAGVFMNPEALLALTVKHVVRGKMLAINASNDLFITFARPDKVDCSRPHVSKIRVEEQQHCRQQHEAYAEQVARWTPPRSRRRAST